LQAIAAAYRKLEVRNGNAEHLAETILAATSILVVVHVAGGIGVFGEQASTWMIWEDIEDAAITLPGLFILLHVFVQHAQVQKRAEMCGELAGRSFVKVAGVAVVAMAIVFERETKERSSVSAIGGNGAL